MNILVAPNSMKGSLNAFDFADIVEQAFLDCSKKFIVKKIPVADGGDFTAEVLGKELQATRINLIVKDPLGRSITSGYYLSGKTAIIEMAEASGMKLLKPEELNPLETSSFGTGQLILDAVNRGCRTILLTVGGSATVDGGTGMIQALGFSFFDKNKTEIAGNGKNLEHIFSIQKPHILNNISIRVICDVDNPLLGENGAAKVFGPQKGATSEMVEILENGLANWSSVLKKEVEKDISNIPGTGAAGGISIPLLAFFQAEIVPGAEFVLSMLNFIEHLKWADIVITGEGKLDVQTLNNKAPFVVAQQAKKMNLPVYAIAGKVENENLPFFDGAFSLVNEQVSVQDAMLNVKDHLYRISYDLAGKLKSAQKND